MHASAIRHGLAAAVTMAVLSFGVDGAAELPSGLDKKAVTEAFNAVSLTSCKKPGGPTGEGHVLVTLAPSGKVTHAVVDSPPFARTKIARCIAKAYRKIRLPAFKGDPVVLGKKFRIE
jgi:hypothetical protein